MLQRLYHLLLVFREYVILSGLIVLSLVLLALNDNPQVKRIRSIATVSFGVVQQQVAFIPEYFGLKRENAELRRMNVGLAAEVSQLRDARLENMRLRRLLQMPDRTSERLLAANVVGKNLTLLRNTLTLNVGEADGVKPFMPVVNEAGLVGLTVSASERYTVVNLLLNTDFRASAKVLRSRVDGVVQWDGTDLVLKNVAKTMDVIPGDLLVTSGYSNMFPPDLRIGVVKRVEEQPGTMFKRILVEPSVNFVRLEEVFVMMRTPSEERAELERETARRFSR
jgi:rod shape-determining protein MreC